MNIFSKIKGPDWERECEYITERYDTLEKQFDELRVQNEKLINIINKLIENGDKKI